MCSSVQYNVVYLIILSYDVHWRNDAMTSSLCSFRVMSDLLVLLDQLEKQVMGSQVQRYELYYKIH